MVRPELYHVSAGRSFYIFVQVKVVSSVGYEKVLQLKSSAKSEYVKYSKSAGAKINKSVHFYDP